MFWKLQENVVSDSDLNTLVDFIRHTKRFSQFEKVREFEAAYSDWMGCKHSVFGDSGKLGESAHDLCRRRTLRLEARR